MNLFSSNWIWLMLGIGALVLFITGQGCGTGKRVHDRRPED